MRVGLLNLIQRLSRRLGTKEAFVLMPWLVLGIGLLTTAAICEQTRHLGEEEHLRIESTLLDNVVDGLESKLQTNIATLAAGKGSRPVGALSGDGPRQVCPSTLRQPSPSSLQMDRRCRITASCCASP